MKFSFQIFMDFPFADTTYFCIVVPHGYVVQIVQVAEYADFSEFGHSGQQGELDVAIHRFQCSVEWLQGVPELFLKFFVSDGLQHGLVVFVYQDDHALSGLFAGTFDDAGKAQGGGTFGRIGTIELFQAANDFSSMLSKLSAVSYFSILRSMWSMG